MIARAALVFACLVTAGCDSATSQSPSATPSTRPANEIGARIKSLPEYARFSFSGVAFYDGELFVTTNVGLLEFQGITPKLLHSWYSNDDVVEGPWIDGTTNSLWIRHMHDAPLRRLDRAGWRLVALPPPPNGYYSRGDVLRGFRGVPAASGFRLLAADEVWLRDESERWILQAPPPDKEFGSIGVAFWRGREVRVMETKFCIRVTGACKFLFHWKEGSSWGPGHALPVTSVEQLVGTQDGVFLRGGKGELLRIDDDGAVQVETPAACDVIARTSDDRLIASFVGIGIFTRKGNEWLKAFDYPFDSSEGEHWAHLAEQNGIVAYSTTSKIKASKTQPPSGPMKWEYSGSTTLWISEGTKLVAVNVGN